MSFWEHMSCFVGHITRNGIVGPFKSFFFFFNIFRVDRNKANVFWALAPKKSYWPQPFQPFQPLILEKLHPLPGCQLPRAVVVFYHCLGHVLKQKSQQNIPRCPTASQVKSKPCGWWGILPCTPPTPPPQSHPTLPFGDTPCSPVSDLLTMTLPLSVWNVHHSPKGTPLPTSGRWSHYFLNAQLFVHSSDRLALHYLYTGTSPSGKSISKVEPEAS